MFCWLRKIVAYVLPLQPAAQVNALRRGCSNVMTFASYCADCKFVFMLKAEAPKTDHYSDDEDSALGGGLRETFAAMR